jgi:RimJ/RimL family protein N-acetyltransferase/catechol 2,3-dioxygenase-like lactoylglutathione lyase family enzyme
MPPVLDSERLHLRSIQSADISALHSIYADERAMRFMPSKPHQSIEETLTSLQHDMQMPNAQHWAICLKENDAVIGIVNYLGGTRVTGMGYILHPDYWGQDITTEACGLALQYGFEHLGYDRVELWIDERNTASLRVAQKLGFQQKGFLHQKYTHRSKPHKMLIWGLLASEWHERFPPASDVEFYALEPVLYVHDVVKTAEYYRDKLGFRIDYLFGEPPDHAGISRGLWSSSMVTIQLSQISPETPIKPTGYLHIRVADAQQLYDEYHKNDVQILAEPSDKPWSLREFVIKDMNGHILIFASPS